LKEKVTFWPILNVEVNPIDFFLPKMPFSSFARTSPDNLMCEKETFQVKKQEFFRNKS